MNSRGAVEIDSTEHSYVHPDYVDQLQDHRAFNMHTVYDAIEHGIRTYGE